MVNYWLVEPPEGTTMLIRDWLDRNMVAGTPQHACRAPFEMMIGDPVGLQSDISEEMWETLSDTLKEMSDTGCGVRQTAMVLATYLIARNAHWRARVATAF